MHLQSTTPSVLRTFSPRLVKFLFSAAFEAQSRFGIRSFLVVGSFDHVLCKLYPGFYGVAVKAGVSAGDQMLYVVFGHEEEILLVDG